MSGARSPEGGRRPEPTSPPGEAELAVAVAAVEEAGALLCRHFEEGVAADWKGDRDPVTAADREAEALIRGRIAETFPQDLIVGEEGAELSETDVAGRRRWYVDPLDGTVNFLKRRRRWACSVGFSDEDGRMLAGAVRLPLYDETYAARAGHGATCGGRPLRATPTDRLEEALVLVGALGGDRDADRRAVSALAGRVLSLRITGSTVSDLVDIAAGRGDAFWATVAGRWDLAAGVLIATEAGVRVTDTAGTPVVGTAPTVLAAAPGVHAALLDLVRRA
jgi:myo-inositol-1(or 4)-monophosphatase